MTSEQYSVTNPSVSHYNTIIQNIVASATIRELSDQWKYYKPFGHSDRTIARIILGGNSPITQDSINSLKYTDRTSPLSAYASDFKALVNSRHANTDTAYDISGQGPPIYWVGGKKVANDYADFYSNSWGTPEPRTESGARLGIEFNPDTKRDSSVVATGSGGKPLGSDPPSRTLDKDGNAIPGLHAPPHVVGCGSTTVDKPLDYRHCSIDIHMPIYGISPVFKVAGGSDTRPTVGITGTTTVMEGGNITVNFKVSSSIITVYYHVEEEGDFVKNKAELGIIRSAFVGNNGEVKITTDNDHFDESAGRVVVTLVPHNSYTIDSARSSMSYTIQDDDDDQNYVKFTTHQSGGGTERHIHVHLTEGGSAESIGFKLSVAPERFYTPGISWPSPVEDKNRISCYTGSGEGNITVHNPIKNEGSRDRPFVTLNEIHSYCPTNSTHFTFDANNWDTPQYLKIKSGQDDDTLNHQYNIVFSDRWTVHTQPPPPQPSCDISYAKIIFRRTAVVCGETADNRHAHKSLVHMCAAR